MVITTNQLRDFFIWLNTHSLKKRGARKWSIDCRDVYYDIPSCGIVLDLYLHGNDDRNIFRYRIVLQINSFMLDDNGGFRLAFVSRTFWKEKKRKRKKRLGGA
jgi:hypothetical protein